MRSIGVLKGMRKKKRTGTARWIQHIVVPPALFAVLVSGLFLPPQAAAAQDASRLGTRDNGAVIARDPETGSSVMRTPEPKPQDEYQGPQTIIVSPEVYPGGNRPNGQGQRPPSSHKPRPR